MDRFQIIKGEELPPEEPKGSYFLGEVKPTINFWGNDFPCKISNLTFSTGKSAGKVTTSLTASFIVSYNFIMNRDVRAMIGTSVNILVPQKDMSYTLKKLLVMDINIENKPGEVEPFIVISGTCHG